jgi:hypothetical protein
MKKKDIFTIVIVGIFSAVFSIVISNLLINNEDNRSETVEVIPVISSSFERPPEEYFNSESINPTQTIQIGEENASQPFGSSQ